MLWYVFAVKYRMWGLIGVHLRYVTHKAARKAGHAVWRSLVMYGWTLYPYGPCPCLSTEARHEP